MSFLRYEAYKDSGVEWLGDVPRHWEVKKLRRCIVEHRQGYYSSDGYVDDGVRLLRITDIHEYGKIDFSECPRVERKADQEQFHLASGDFLFARTGGAGTFGLIEYLPEPAIYASYLIRFRFSKGVYASFFAFYFMTDGFQEELRKNMHGGVNQNVHAEDIKDQYISLPSEREQADISAFLDRETAKIDALVEEQQRLIALLKEKRQAVISHAVTKGLDPDAPMKDSGVEWLGEVPAHWEVKPLKYCASFRSGGTPDKANVAYWSGDISWASAKDLKLEVLFDTQDHITDKAVQDGAAELIPAGSVIVLVRGMMLARTFPVVRTAVDTAINQDLKALDGGPEVENSFLAWLLRGTSKETLNRLDEAGHGTKALRMEAWVSLKIAVPPRKEQDEIVGFIERQTTKLDQLTSEAEAAIGLLQERRSALISAAVTGKIDVRALSLSQAEAA